MNWIRDNIIKILIILGVAVVAIIVIAVLARPKGEVIEKGGKYGELETKLQNAAIRYIDKHKKLLPESTDEVTKVKLNTLISNNFIGRIVAVDNANTKCDGYVEIEKISEDKNDYRYTPFLSCGDYYITKTIGQYIIDAETNDGEFVRTSDSGLYKYGDEYIFRGEEVNNYILLDEHLYRIMKIDANKSLQLISVDKTGSSLTWDNRYNIERDRDDGINTFLKSRLYESLNSLFEETDSERSKGFFGENEKDYIIPHEFCIGKRSLNDGDIYSGAECKETATLKVGLISLNEYARVSIDPNCKTIFDRSCANYNYFTTLGTKNTYTYVTVTGLLDNTYQFYRIRFDEVELTKTSVASQVYPVIYINSKTIYSKGTGTYNDPYVVR